MNPLFYNDDDPETVEFIKYAISKKYFVTRHTRLHIAIGSMNFWPTTGSISIGGGLCLPDKGFSAAYALLKTISPKATHKYQAKLTDERTPSTTPRLVFSLNLDDG